MLGALPENGETYFTPVADSFTSDVTVQFLKALQAKFGKYVHVNLYNATYFTSNKVSEFHEDSSLEVTYLPTGSPDMNPGEECWRQFSQFLGNRFFGGLAELGSADWPELKSISAPNIHDYLYPSI